MNKAYRENREGDEGTANVIYSDWMDIEWNGADETYNKAMIIEEPLVADISDKGTLLMYVTDEIGTVALMIPFLYDNDFFYFYAVNSSNVGLALTVESLDGTTPVFDYAAIGFRVRFVLIPGGVPIGKMQDSFWEDYEAVSSYFGIPD